MTALKRNVTVIDYGVSNILSLCRAIEHCGATVEITESTDRIRAADRLVLPGVGAFFTGMENLKKRGAVEPIEEHVKNGKPFLGVCLGMQMMFESSMEMRDHEGLGLLKGKVTPLPATRGDGAVNRIPNIGWGRLAPAAGRDPGGWKNTILDDLDPGSYVFFIHSYRAEPAEGGAVLARTEFGDDHFVSVVRRGNAFGAQFHPEKSGEVGLKILRNFLAM